MTPEASLDSGLDVLSVRKLARRSVPRIAWQVFGSARHVHGRDIDYVHDARHVVVTSQAPFPVQVDGMRSAITAAWSGPRARGPLVGGLANPSPRNRCRLPRWIPHSHLERPAQRPHVRARRGTAAGCMARIRWTRTRVVQGIVGQRVLPQVRPRVAARHVATGFTFTIQDPVQLVPVDGCRRPGRGRVAPERGDPRVAASEAPSIGCTLLMSQHRSDRVRRASGRTRPPGTAVCAHPRAPPRSNRGAR